jgi:rhamnulokinase
VRLASVGVDSWAVDYGLVDASGRLLEEPVCYRDARTDGVMEDVFAQVPRDEIFARTGIQFLKLNTLYQLVAQGRAGWPAEASRLLMVPDLCHHRLCGAMVSEHTNATTTQLLDARCGEWDGDLLARLDLPAALMPPIVPAGRRLGGLDPALARRLGLSPMDVIAPATHDTASAVAGTPLEDGWAYVSSGTWSLIGVELARPLLGPEVARANFTNEGGVFGSTRFLKNVMGLWILESCRKEWGLDDPAARAAHLERVAAVEAFAGFVSPDDERFFNPSSMAAELQAALRESGQAAPDDPVLLTRVILDSLALRYASVIDTIERLTGRAVPGVHIVGGGSRNDYLDQATANACGRPVQAGPVEATAIGNLLVQSLSSGGVASLAEGRRVVARAVVPRTFAPRDSAAWTAARSRYRELWGETGP